MWEGGGHSHGIFGHSHGPSTRSWREFCWEWRRSLFRLALRLSALTIIIVLIRMYPEGYKSAANEASNAVWLAGSQVGSAFAALGLATAFCSISPTGYFPAIALGVSFPPYISIPVTYASVQLGALFNALLVRWACLGWLPSGLRETYEARGAELLGTGSLGPALDARPIFMVAILRLPFLANGALNYILSLRSQLPLGKMLFGNALGFIPGSVLFPLAGAQLRSLGSMIAGGLGEGSERDRVLGTTFGVMGAVGVAVLITVYWTTRIIGRLKEEREKVEAGAAGNVSGRMEEGHLKAERKKILSLRGVELTNVREAKIGESYSAVHHPPTSTRTLNEASTAPVRGTNKENQ